MKNDSSPALPLLGEMAFSASGDIARLVTFLNQTLKQHGFIFGLSKEGDGYRLAIYRDPDEEE